MQVVFSLCMEFLPASSRGFWLVFMEVLWTVGDSTTCLFPVFSTAYSCLCKAHQPVFQEYGSCSEI
jgi:hypothetical protein